LPHHAEPVVAGALERDPGGSIVRFAYGDSYRRRDEAISIYEPELPLRAGTIDPMVGDIAGCLRDAGPDSWGRRVIAARLGLQAEDIDELTYLLQSGSDRIGALDFQASASAYVGRDRERVSLDDLADAADRIERHEPLPPAIADALLHGTSIGGARPKALIDDGKRQLIAKFATSVDVVPIVQWEFVAMHLAALAGIRVAAVEMTRAAGRAALLVERFDRPPDGGRRAMVSAMTVLGLDEWSAMRAASYVDLADQVRARFTHPAETLRELFARITFNVLVSNTDDHARNTAAFWDGRAHTLELTPAYDVCPQPRAGEAKQAMAIGRDGWRFSQVAGCVARAGEYQLTEREAGEIVDRQIAVIDDGLDDAIEIAELTKAQATGLRGGLFLNAYALEGYRRVTGA
jgi:serine/threonine-protein kinase HipA